MSARRGMRSHVAHRDGARYAWAIWRRGQIVRRIIDASQRDARDVALAMDAEERERSEPAAAE